MRVGVPKETAPGERRVALVPETVGRLGSGRRGRRRARRRRPSRLRRRGVRRGGRDDRRSVGVRRRRQGGGAERRRDRAAARRSGAGRVPRAAHRRRGRRAPRRGRCARARARVDPADHARAADGRALVAGDRRGYKAALLAADRLPRFLPMLMTAAGTIPPAKVLVLGAGVAGLQAIATARRLGAVVCAFDVRPGRAGAGRVARRDVPRPRRVGRGDRGRLRARADARAAGGSSRPSSRRAFRSFDVGDHDGGDPRAARAEAHDGGRGARRCAPAR